MEGEKKKRLPTFTPHVTLVGGISISECCTVEDDVLPLLQQQPLPQQQQRDGMNTWRDGVDDTADEKKEEDYDDKKDDVVLDEVAAKSVLIRLANAFCNFGGVECTFVKERGVFAARRRQRRKEEEGDNGNNKSNDNNNSEEEGEVQWNQSCISIMERTDSFTKAVELADQVLLSPTTTTTTRSTTTSSYNEHGHDKEHDQLALSASSSFERHLKPPTCEPHYSFVYGNDASLISSLQPSSSSSSSSSNHVSSCGGGIMKKKNDDLVLQCPPDFTSTEIAVMWTYPSTLEGVEQWREIGRFSLVAKEEGVTQSKY
jgi:hypothetical protein